MMMDAGLTYSYIQMTIYKMRRIAMKQNMGVVDRIIRLALAALIVVLIALNVFSVPLAVVLGVVAAVFVGTSILGLCPLYLPFGITTKKK
jgi:hypothetical protein